MGQQISVETLCGQDEDLEGRYWCSFEPYPYRVGARKLSYMGILNGEGPRRGKRCLVKAFRQGCATRADWHHEKERAMMAKSLALEFNREMSEIGERVNLVFHTPMLVEIDEVSSYMCIAMFLGKPRKKMRELEYVSVEPYLSGKFQNFNSSKTKMFDSMVMNAYSHYTWCCTQGECVVTGMKGVKQFENYYLTVPVVHSRDQKYGRTDMGQMGIDNFFANHQCNDFCRNLPRLDELACFPKDCDLDLVAFQLESAGFFTKKMNTEFLASPRKIGSTVHCDKPSHCVCEFFRLPCPHRIEHTSGLIYAINRSFVQEKSR
ncbi:alpha-protein kinase vwkA-like [Saccostrea echinata]|uniref:alpha-protein kinase vwkA-like n=1 Tax=Saccostrea echinata TaxID=191078 RepID=UPI002A81FB20|nr:alpha-protein kinase vwkA-like [Saccostrea echinata]XP_061198254.1 alpha-protein kinase vwkA-like [Saccostrea echinata]